MEGYRVMGHIKCVVEIEAPVEAVFAYVDDYKNTTKYMRDLTRWAPVGGKTHGKGAVFDVAMAAGPKTLDSVIEMTGWTENKSISWESTGGFHQKGSWKFTSKAGVTSATYEMEYEFGGGIAGKVLAKVAEPIVRMNIEKSIEQLRIQVEKAGTKGTVSKTGTKVGTTKTAKAPAKR